MNIAVTGLNATDNPGPGVPIIRSITASPDFKGKMTGLIYDTLEPGIYMDGIVSKCYLIPYPSSGLQDLFDRIELINSKEKIDIIIPSLDSELYGFLKLQHRLEDIGIKTFLPTLEQLNIRGKDKLFYFCEDNNIKVPKNILLNSSQDLYNIPKDFEYPVAVKGIFYEAYIAHNLEEVTTAFNKLRLKWGYPIIIQEFIQGDEFNVAALGDGTGNMVGGVAMRKLYITDKGKGWAGITIDDPNLITISRKIIEKTKWRSGMELEFIKSAETGEYYLLEINPRFPAWVYLTVAAGQNLPYALVDLICKGKVEPFKNYEIGKIFVRSSWDLITDIKAFEKIATFGEI
jgi:carbamoyl-phosphate synthase large subunit